MKNLRYEDWADLMDRVGGYNWEAHQVVTEDGWRLTVFRILPHI